MSHGSLHQAFCLRVAGQWDRAALLEGAIEDVLAHLPVLAVLLRAGDSEEFGHLQQLTSEWLQLVPEGEMWVALPEPFDETEKGPLLELLKSHFQACLSLTARVGLAERVVEESRALIVASSKMAAVGQLAAGVAHELNSPLGAVMLQLDAARLNIERQRYEKAVGKLISAENAAVTAKQIISKLLFYSRDATKGLHDLSLNDVVDDTLALLGKQLSYDNLDLRVSLGQIPCVMGNDNELQQVVINLLLNAKDAALAPEASQATVDVVTFSRDGMVYLEVRDGGPGVPEELRVKIFDPFFTTKPAGRGTGLGLSVSLEIVERHGGQLSVASTPDGGARFRLALPVKPPKKLIEETPS